MDEAEWLACSDPQPMLRSLFGKASERRLRLFACACCGRVQALLDDYSRRLLSSVERFADSPLSAGKLDSLRNDAMAHADGLSYRMGSPDGCARWLAASAVWHASEGNALSAALDTARAVECARQDPATFTVAAPAPPSSGDPAERAAQADLLRCTFGNPFRPVSLAPAWRTPAVLALAAAAYGDRRLPSGILDPERLAVLADALEDAGCDNPDLLNHLRIAGVHVRGCWAVDCVPGKS